jgi:hypothetical protein
VNLLLLLSALLSALSGMGQAVRGGRAPQTVCATVAARRTTAAPRRATRRPVPPLLRAFEAILPALAVLGLTPAQPIFAGRRRE